MEPRFLMMRTSGNLVFQRYGQDKVDEVMRFGEPDVEQFGQGRALRPGDECPFAQRLNETVGNHELHRGNLAGVEAEACNDFAEP